MRGALEMCADAFTYEYTHALHALIDTSCEFANDLNACDSTADDEDMVCFSCCCSPLCKFLEPSGSEQPVVILDVRPFVRAAIALTRSRHRGYANSV